MPITFFHGGKRNNKEQKLAKEEFQIGDHVRVNKKALGDKKISKQVAKRLGFREDEDLSQKTFKVTEVLSGSDLILRYNRGALKKTTAICHRFFEKHKEQVT